MRNLFLFIKRFYPFFLFGLLEIISVIFISQSNSYQHNTIINSSNVVSGKIYESRKGVKQYFNLRILNNELADDNARLRAQLNNFLDHGDTTLIDTIGEKIYEFWPATVINHTTFKKHNYFTLNKGAADGIVEDMGVVDPEGIIGMITNVSRNYSVGLSMLNTNTKVSVKHKKSGALGRMRWQGNDPQVHIVEDITKTARVRVGDTLVTSGYSTYFPKDVNVGVVTNTSLKEGSNFFDINLKLTNDIMSLDQVYVINHFFKQELDSLENKTE